MFAWFAIRSRPHTYPTRRGEAYDADPVPKIQTDEVDQAIQPSLGNTSESWKVALIIAASDARKQGQAAARRNRQVAGAGSTARSAATLGRLGRPARGVVFAS